MHLIWDTEEENDTLTGSGENTDSANEEVEEGNTQEIGILAYHEAIDVIISVAETEKMEEVVAPKDRNH